MNTVDVESLLTRALKELRYVGEWADMDASERHSLSEAIGSITKALEAVTNRGQTRIVAFENESARIAAERATEWCHEIERRGGTVREVHCCSSGGSSSEDIWFAIFVVASEPSAGK